MGTVIALGVRAVVCGQVIVHIVEGIGNLGAAVQSLTGDGISLGVSVQVLQNCVNVSRSQRGIGGLGLSSERGMIQIQTGIDNRDLHTLAGVAQILPDLCNAGHAAGSGGVGIGSFVGLDGIINGHHKDALDVVHHCDLFQILELRLDGERVGQVSELITDIQFLALQQGLLDFLDDLVLNIKQLLLIGSSNSCDGAVALSQRLLFHNNERGYAFLAFEDLSGLLQLLNALRELGQGQRDGRRNIGLGCIPGAVALSILRGLNFRKNDGIITQIEQTFGLRILGYDQIVFKGGSFVFCGSFFGLFGADIGVFGRSRCIDRGRNDRNQQAQGQKHCQQAFTSHKSTSLGIFPSRMQTHNPGECTAVIFCPSIDCITTQCNYKSTFLQVK